MTETFSLTTEGNNLIVVILMKVNNILTSGNSLYIEEEDINLSNLSCRVSPYTNCCLEWNIGTHLFNLLSQTFVHFLSKESGYTMT